MTPLAIAVCLKFTVDVSQLRPDPATGRPDLARARYRVNEFDENALEEAVRLKERYGGRIVAVSLVEREPPRDVLLRPLAAGADALYLVTHPAAASGDACVSATLLAAALREIGARCELPGWDLVLCGDASSDVYDGQVGPRLAEALGIVPITCVIRLELEGGRAVATRALEDVVHTVEAELPALVTVGAETNHPRLPHLRQIMDAGQKPIEHLAAAELDGGGFEDVQAGLELLDLTAPTAARRQLRLEAGANGRSGADGAAELARDLVHRLLAAGELAP